MFKRAWRRWMKVGEFLGNFQMIVILTLVYWIVMTLTAIPFKLLADPLALRDASRSRWIQRARVADVLESMRKQG